MHVNSPADILVVSDHDFLFVNGTNFGVVINLKANDEVLEDSEKWVFRIAAAKSPFNPDIEFPPVEHTVYKAHVARHSTCTREVRQPTTEEIAELNELIRRNSTS